jgi:hypothetical protein
MTFAAFTLLTIACMSAFSIATFLLFTRHGARHATKLPQAGNDIRADLEQLRNETNSKIEKLENEISKLKAEFALATPSLVDFSIVPTIKGSLDNDPEDRNETGSDAVQPANSDPQLEKAFSEIAKAFAAAPESHEINKT